MPEQPSWLDSQAAGLGGGAILVEDELRVQALLEDLLDPRRVGVVIGLAPSFDDEDEPVIPVREVRPIAGPHARIYRVLGEFPLQRLDEELGGRLTLCADAARIWWPGLTRSSDPGDHPLVMALDGESATATLGEFARQFDLSRPHVRREIRVLEDLLALAEHNLALANAHNSKTEERLRDAHRERHREALRAESAQREAGE
ncbi:MAG TPA: hypothetical protein VGY13_12135 [Solirubrobacteraceae bacterium]|jgi:hypothetical protein|nr:hypothetical protein [Solirubrobacteraceae bacterium]